MAFQQQDQCMIRLNAKEQVQMELLKDQLDSCFEVFRGILDIVDSRDVDEVELLGHNDMAVSMIKCFGKTCRRYRSNNKKKALRATFGYFENLRNGQSHNDRMVLRPWFQYIECALASNKPLPKLKISTQTHLMAKKAMTEKIGGFMSTYLGANHQTADQIQHVKDNLPQYTEKNDSLIRGSRNRYNAAQSNAQMTFPTQSDVYSLSGGSHNVQFGKPMNEDDKKTSKYQADSDGDCDLGDNEQPQMNLLNAYITGGAPEALWVRGKNKRVTYPMPCQVVGQSRGVMDVVLAAPFEAHRVSVPAAFVQTSPHKVRHEERKYRESHGWKGLGYPSMDEKSNGKNRNY